MQEFIDHISTQLHLSPSMKERLLSLTTVQKFKKGDTLGPEYSIQGRVFLIKSGAARIYYLKEGKDITTWFAFEKDLLISIRSKFSRQEYPEIIEFLEDTEVITIQWRERRDPAKESNIFIYSMANRILLAYSRFLEERLIVLQNITAKERYEWVVTRYPHLLQRARLGQIASYLGITKETLYRIRSGKYSG